MSRYLVDPLNITDFNLTVSELELRLLWWICAAGKNALTAARGLDNFLTSCKSEGSPFEIIRGFGVEKLPQALKDNGIGCYNNKAKSFWQLANSGLNLRTCSLKKLEEIHGIGMKTSRCFIIHSRRDATCAGLDTHILSYLRDQGYEAPTSTPAKKQYLKFEEIFVDLARKSGLSVAEFDLDIWRTYRSKHK